MRQRLRDIDPWGPVLAAVAVVVFLIQGFEGRLMRDVAVYAYAGQQLAEGVPPYVAILNRAGPLAHLIPGLGAAAGRAVGVDDLLAMRVTLMVVSVLGVWVAYMLGRDLWSSRLAGAMTAATLMTFQGFVTYAVAGPREKTTMVLFVLLALWAVARRGWVGAGVATALATLTWQGAFFPLAAAATLAILALRGRRPRLVALVRFGGAGLAVTAVAVVGFAAVGALAELYEGFYAVNAGFARRSGLRWTLPNPERLVNGFGWSLGLVVAGIVAALLLPVLRFRRIDRDLPADVAVAGVGLGTLVCLLWGLMSFQGWPDALVMLPFAACGVAGMAHLLRGRLPDAVSARVTTVLVVVALVAAAGSSFTKRSDDALAEQRRDVTDVVAILDDPVVLSVSDPTPLVLAGLRNPLRYQLFTGGQKAYLAATYPGGIAGLASTIEELRPTVITIRNPRTVSWISPVLKRHYKRFGGQQRSYVWYASVRDTTRSERVELRRTAREGLSPSGQKNVRRSVP